MGRKNNRKNYKQSKKSNKFSKSNINKRKFNKGAKNELSSRDKNKFKFIRRNQEAEAALRAQNQIERKMLQQEVRKRNDSSSSEDCDSNQPEPMEQLLAVLKLKTNAIAVSTDSSNDSEDDDEVRNVFEHKKGKVIDSDEEEFEEVEEVEEEEEEEEEVEEEEVEDEITDSDFAVTESSISNDSHVDCDIKTVFETNNAAETNQSTVYEFNKQNKQKHGNCSKQNDVVEADTVLNIDKNERSDDDDQDEVDVEILNDKSVFRPEERTDKTNIKQNLDEFVKYDDNSDEDDEIDEDNGIDDADKFYLHFNHELSIEFLETLNSGVDVEETELKWPNLCVLKIDIPKYSPTVKENIHRRKIKKIRLLDDEKVYAKQGSLPDKLDYVTLNLNQLHIKQQIHPQIIRVNAEWLSNEDNNIKIFTPLQTELFSIIKNYQDLYYSYRTFNNGEEIRYIYCLHSINHVLKTRAKILHHNAKLKKLSENGQVVPDTDNYRDQGLFRAKVLIILPFRDSALRVIKLLAKLLFEKPEGKVMNYKRFLDEYSGQQLHFPKHNPKPLDYELTFAENSDDTFRIGLAVTRKCIKLYTDFYSSDIIIASPLGLRLIIGAPGERDRDYDFLASIELLIFDQADIVLAQNWDHIINIFDHLHLQPQSARDSDFSRVRNWCLNGWSRFYRQTLLFTSNDLPEFRSLFNKRCNNYQGKIRIVQCVVQGTAYQVEVKNMQVFHRIDVTSIEASYDERFEYFTKTVLPQFMRSSMAHCLIFIPSYYDYVRIRNYFKRENLNFIQICEYTRDSKVARARDMFFHGSAHFLLYTERAHFFRRIRLKGIRHIIMYQPPSFSHFYSELINFMLPANQNPRDGFSEQDMTIQTLYTTYDLLKVSAIIGTDSTLSIALADSKLHIFTTRE